MAKIVSKPGRRAVLPGHSHQSLRLRHAPMAGHNLSGINFINRRRLTHRSN
jgi:hypothetical protein